MIPRISLLLVATMASSALAQPLRVEIPDSKFWQDRSYQRDFLETYVPLREAEPKISEDEVELFQELLELIKVQPAAAAARLESAITPNSSAALNYVLGNLHLQSGNMDRAAAAYEQAITKFSDYRRAHKNLGLVHFQNQEFKDALEHLTKAIELGDREGRTYGRLAYGYLQMGNAVAAESAYRNAIIMDPDNLDWKLGLAQTLMQQNRHGEVISIMEPIIAAEPDKHQYWLFQTNGYLGLEDLDNAATNLEIIRRLGEATPSNLKLLGNIYLRREMPARALDAFSAVLTLENAKDHLDIAIDAVDLFNRLGEFGRAAELLATVREVELNSEQELEVLNLQAKVQKSLGNADEAARLLKQIVERDPRNGEALIELGNYYADQGEPELAEFQYEAAAKVEEHAFDAMVAEAQMHARNRDFSDAIELLRNALRIKQDNRVANYLDRLERAQRSL